MFLTEGAARNICRHLFVVLRLPKSKSETLNSRKAILLSSEGTRLHSPEICCVFGMRCGNSTLVFAVRSTKCEDPYERRLVSSSSPRAGRSCCNSVSIAHKRLLATPYTTHRVFMTPRRRPW